MHCRYSRDRRIRLPDVLRRRRCGHDGSRGRLRGEDSRRNETGRPSDRAADQVRSRHQRQSRTSHRHHNPAVDVVARQPGDRMKRRVFLGGLATLSLPAFAQPPPPPQRIAFLTLSEGIIAPAQPAGLAFLSAMKELGYHEGRDFILEERLWDRQEDAPAMARELVALKTDVIIAAGPPSILAARDGTREIPIVMMHTADPVAAGIV